MTNRVYQIYIAYTKMPNVWTNLFLIGELVLNI